MFLGVVAGSLLAPANVSTSSSPAAPRRLSLGVIFLTLYIDLIGFSIIFPLGPDLLSHYLNLEGSTGALGWMLGHVNALARSFGIESYAPVLFGGVLGGFRVHPAAKTAAKSAAKPAGKTSAGKTATAKSAAGKTTAAKKTPTTRAKKAASASETEKPAPKKKA